MSTIEGIPPLELSPAHGDRRERAPTVGSAGRRIAKTLLKDLLGILIGAGFATLGVTIRWTVPELASSSEAIFFIAVFLGTMLGGWPGGLAGVAASAATMDIVLPKVAQSPVARGVFIGGAAMIAGVTLWLHARVKLLAEQLGQTRAELEGRVDRRTSKLMLAVSQLRQEVRQRKQAEEGLRSVAAHARCILWDATVEGPPNVKEASGAAPCLLWAVRVQDETAAQEVLPLDLEPGESYFKKWAKSRLPDDAAGISRACAEAIVQNQPGYTHEYRCHDRKGRVRWLLEDVRIEAAGAGRWRLFGVTTDVTDRKRALEALRLSEERFTLFMEHLPGVAMIKSQDGKYLFMNHGGEELFGLYNGQWMGHRDADLHGMEQARRFALTEQSVLETGQSCQSLEMLDTPRGKRCFVFTWFLVRGTASSGALMAALGIDITHRRQAEEKLLAHQKKLRAMAAKASMNDESERRQIASALHDEIGSTLAIAQIRLKMLLGTPDSALVAATAQELTNVVKDLDHAIAQTRSLTCELSPPLLYEAGLVAAIKWLGEQVAERHGLKVSVDGSTQVEQSAQELKIVLYQGVRELLTNVVKHARARRVRVRARRDHEFVSVSVRDDGVGLPANTQKSETSFGLFNLRERIDYLGGKIVFATQPGKGTEVTISLPAESPSATAPKRVQSGADAS